MASRRPPRSPRTAGGLPAELAAGPLVELWAPHVTGRQAQERAAAVAWTSAGTTWSRANLGNWNGWRSLLPPEVRGADSARTRLLTLKEH